MALYTKGPWRLVPSGDGRLLIAGGRAPDPITRARYLWVAEANLPPVNPDVPWDFLTMDESLANARLIEQCPTLLYAAQQVSSLVPNDGRWRLDVSNALINLERVIKEAGG